MAGKTLVYDGDCTFCRCTVAVVAALRLVPRASCRSSRDLDPDELDWLKAEGLRNEMIVLGPAGEIRRGADGILWIARDGWAGPAAWVLGLPLLRAVTTFVYRVISYNRRAIAPPSPRGVKCDCDPEPHAGYQAAFVVVCTLIVLTNLSLLVGRPVLVGEWLPVVAYGGAFLGLGSAAVVTRGLQGLQYLTHLAATAVPGSLLLLPAAVPFRDAPEAEGAWQVAWHAVAYLVMCFLHGRHVAFLRMGAGHQVAFMLLVLAVFALAPLVQS